MHFTVGVLVDKKGKKLEELLAPYQENNMGNCPKEFLEFREATEEINEYEDHKEDYETLDEFMEDYYGIRKDKETEKYGYWENPNAQWDWYQIGGRWSNMLLSKNGYKSNYLQLKDIDWNGMYEISKKQAIETWDSNENEIYRMLNGIKKDDTKESYIERMSKFETYAVITPDGKWHSKDKMGLFSVSTNEDDNRNKSFYDIFIKDADQELILVIVDCHI